MFIEFMMGEDIVNRDIVELHPQGNYFCPRSEHRSFWREFIVIANKADTQAIVIVSSSMSARPVPHPPHQNFITGFSSTTHEFHSGMVSDSSPLQRMCMVFANRTPAHGEAVFGEGMMDDNLFRDENSHPAININKKS